MSTRIRRRRNSQQWILDWLTKRSGRVQNFAYDERVVPPEAKSYAMIPHAFERAARHVEQVARGAEAAGHLRSAHEHYWRAATLYREAQHAIFADDDPEKIYLHGKLLACYERVIALSPYPVKRVEIPWEGVELQGVFHMTGEPGAPTVLEVGGMDHTKETYPDPTDNAFLSRGLNVLCFDGPGQGTSNIRKIRVTDDNFERAGSAAIDWLVQQPEVDPERIAVNGISMGSLWAMRIASIDHRVAALATALACFTAKRAIFEEASPRFKQVFMYMAGLEDEDEFDEMAGRMTMDGHAGKIRCPSLTAFGEYDPLAPLEEALPIWEQLPRPRELWLWEDDFHSSTHVQGLGGENVYHYTADWLRDALDGRIEADRDLVRVIPRSHGAGPYEPAVRGVYLPDRLSTDP